IRSMLTSMRARGWGLGRYLRHSPDTTIKAVVFEDGAALTGLVIAAAGITLAELTGTEAWDAIGSLAIGIVLAAVAFVLGHQSRHLLLGAAAEPETRAAIAAIVIAFPEVDHIIRLLTMQLGS